MHTKFNYEIPLSELVHRFLDGLDHTNSEISHCTIDFRNFDNMVVIEGVYSPGQLRDE